jgi:hypothetical protein
MVQPDRHLPKLRELLRTLHGEILRFAQDDTGVRLNEPCHPEPQAKNLPSAANTCPNCAKGISALPAARDGT